LATSRSALVSVVTAAVPAAGCSMPEADQEFCLDQELDTNALEPLRAWVDDLLAGQSRLSGLARDASIENAQEFLGAYLLEDVRPVQMVDKLEESLVAVGSTPMRTRALATTLRARGADAGAGLTPESRKSSSSAGVSAHRPR
jgi:hypothetical protein